MVFELLVCGLLCKGHTYAANHPGTRAAFLCKKNYGVGHDLRRDIPNSLNWGPRNLVSLLLGCSIEGLISHRGTCQPPIALIIHVNAYFIHSSMYKQQIKVGIEIKNIFKIRLINCLLIDVSVIPYSQ